MDFLASGYINPKIAVLLWVVGMCIKHIQTEYMKRINNRFIPAILMMIGVLESVIMAGDVTFDSVLTGVITAIFAVGVHASGKNVFSELKKVYTGIGTEDIQAVATEMEIQNTGMSTEAMVQNEDIMDNTVDNSVG